MKKILILFGLLTIALLIVGCEKPGVPSISSTEPPIAPLDEGVAPSATGPTDVASADSDGDGYGESVDCDDTDPAVNPGAIEGSSACFDSLDNDCDGDIDGSDEDCLLIVCATYYDADGDGYLASTGPGTPALATCPQPKGDCDVNASSIYPGAPEICGDSIDSDCDGTDGTGTVDICGDLIDNDCDGLIDEDCSLDCTDSDGGVEPSVPGSVSVVNATSPTGFTVSPDFCAGSTKLYEAICKEGSFPLKYSIVTCTAECVTDAGGLAYCCKDSDKDGICDLF